MFLKSTPSRIVAAVLVTGAIVAAVAGCAHSAGATNAQPTMPPLTGVIATGTLTASTPDNPVTGTVAVVANPSNGALTVKLSKLTGDLSSASEVDLTAAAVPAGSRCTPSVLAYATGPVTSKADQEFIFPSAKTPGWQNPSFLRSVIITTTSAEADCSYGIVAYSALTWTTGDRRPDIRVSDGGQRGGAHGNATLTDGVPTSYTVVPGDNLDSIASRFHLTVNELFYLNPVRMMSPSDTVTEIGEKLNLSKADR